MNPIAGHAEAHAATPSDRRLHREECIVFPAALGPVTFSGSESLIAHFSSMVLIEIGMERLEKYIDQMYHLRQ
jgi:hypothetical protein